MNMLNQSFPFALLTTILLSISACSDDGADKVGKGISAEREKLAESSDATRHEATKADAAVNDVVLAAKVRDELVKDPALKTSDIYVDSRDGAVVLSGAVDKPEDVIRAVKIARNVDDVKAVDSKLSVRSKG